jgi:succinate dehydrogenase / fumarate reductase cytochrome b subunit
MSRTLQYLSSSIGKKQMMAVTGLLWCGFVLTHMLGNLLTLVSADAYNSYGHKMITNPLLPIAEIGLVVSLAAHVFFAALVVMGNRKARDRAYYVSPHGKGGTTAAAKTMQYTGVLILVFLVFHLIHFKYGVYYPTQYEGQEIRDLYRLMRETFIVPLYTAWYLLCMVVLGFHLRHALSSSLFTLGAVQENQLKKMSILFAVFVSLGFSINPIYFFLKG